MLARGHDEELGPGPAGEDGAFVAALVAMSDRCDSLLATASFPGSRRGIAAEQAARCRLAAEDPVAVFAADGDRRRKYERSLGRATERQFLAFFYQHRDAISEGDPEATATFRRWALRAVLTYEFRVFEAHGAAYTKRFPQRTATLDLLRLVASLVGEEVELF